MTRSAEIAKEIRVVAPNRAAMCIAEYARALGYDERTMRKLLEALPSCGFGRKKLYLIADVSQLLAQNEIKNFVPGRPGTFGRA